MTFVANRSKCPCEICGKVPQVMMGVVGKFCPSCNSNMPPSVRREKTEKFKTELKNRIEASGEVRVEWCPEISDVAYQCFAKKTN